jgi:hypothetical protein
MATPDEIAYAYSAFSRVFRAGSTDGKRPVVVFGFIAGFSFDPPPRSLWRKNISRLANQVESRQGLNRAAALKLMHGFVSFGPLVWFGR